MEDRYTFVELLPMFRARAGLTQMQLAAKLGVHRNTIIAWESGKQPPGSRNMVLDLADALDLDETDMDRLLFALNYVLEHKTPDENLRRSSRMDAKLAAIQEALHRLEDGVGRILEQATARQPGLALALHTLRAPLPDFTGRADDIKALVDHLSQDGGAATITGIRGMGGIGKTELALIVAQQLVGRYPDAALQFELQPGNVPLTPEAVLGSVIHAFQPELRLPDALTELQSLYRTTLSKKRGLLMLDNAAGPEQVRSLLPPPPGWTVLVTSRVRFPLAGALLRDLELLPLEDAIALLRRILSDGGRHDLVAADLTPLAKRCSRLPLALRLAASFLTSYRDWSLPDYLIALEHAPLAHLVAPGETSVQAVLGVSIDRLRERDSTLVGRWEQLAVFPAPFDRVAAAAVWGELGDAPAEDVRAWPELAPLDEEETRRALSALVQQSLLECDAERGNYTLHDLLRECVLAAATVDLDGARLRHAWHYLELGLDANALYKQGGAQVLAGLRQFEKAWSHLTAAWAALQGRADKAAQWWVNQYPNAVTYVLDLRIAPRERVAVLEAAVQAASVLGDRRGEGYHLSNLGNAYADLGDARRAIRYYEKALAISCEIGDRRGEGNALNNLGLVYADLGKVRQAIDCYEKASAIYREIGNRRGEGNALGNLGIAHKNLGDTQQAIGYYEQQLVIVREIGDRRGEGNALSNLGVAYADLGQPQQAIELDEQALAISREIGDRRGEGNRLGNLGLAYADLGEVQRAIGFFEQQLVIVREIGDRRGEGNALSGLGLAYAALREVRQAIEFHEQALAISREIGDRHNEATWLGNLGHAYAALGEARQAIEHYEQQLVIVREIGDRRGEGNALSNLGVAYEKLGEGKRAQELWTEALTIYKEIESPMAERVRGWLEGLPDDHSNLQGNIQL